MRQLRERALSRGVGGEPGIRWRGGEVSRNEGLSDAVFAFAVTLLVVSLEVPRTFDELLNRDVSRSSIESGQTEMLLTIYSVGFLAVFLVFILLHLHAYRRRFQLGLDEVEICALHGRLRGGQRSRLRQRLRKQFA